MAVSPQLANRTITRQRAAVVVDRYGDDDLDWTTPSILEISGCAVQPAGSGDTVDATRTAVSQRWNLFAPPDADIGPDDRIVVDGVTYEVEGGPQKWQHPSGNLDHVIATLIRVEG